VPAAEKEKYMSTALDEKIGEELAKKLRGHLIGREDAGYDEARKVYNAMIDKRPLLIAQCQDAADVVAAVNFGREHDLTIAVRGGGHNGAGLGTCDDGLVIDLRGMRGVRVDQQKGTVQVQGGATLGEVDHATHAYGLAVPSGILSTTGVGGLTPPRICTPSTAPLIAWEKTIPPGTPGTRTSSR
jgi:FAD/FMN-containing dehydrogenase